MMGTQNLWLSPLLLLPGVALLVLSTSARFTRLHEEVHHLLAHKEVSNPHIEALLMRRARLFKNSLVSLYLCIGCFSLGALAGILTLHWFTLSDWLVISMLVPGIAFLIYASIALIMESSLSLHIIEDHYKLL